ncbi:hypothetical protein ACFY05_39360 [Microtetraspora fusca]|uniref:Uncharacterized protein n=1 Tax=Microtetraspora fusca TaxID=1997 RepID=A0ABW6VHT7_MICFU
MRPRTAVVSGDASPPTPALRRLSPDAGETKHLSTVTSAAR